MFTGDDLGSFWYHFGAGAGVDVQWGYDFGFDPWPTESLVQHRFGCLEGSKGRSLCH